VSRWVARVRDRWQLTGILGVERRDFVGEAIMFNRSANLQTLGPELLLMWLMTAEGLSERRVAGYRSFALWWGETRSSPFSSGARRTE
jgi:hypothetical protein